MLDTMFSYNPPVPPSRPKKNEVDYKKNPTKLFKRLEGKAWDLALERIETNDVESKIWVFKTAYDGSVTWKRLPLHEACIHKPIPRIIQSLLQSYPKAASKPDLDGRLPIHHACANGASLDVVEQLLYAYPDGIESQDCWKKTPLATLMSQYFPDPHCISALKRGPEYYKIRRNDQMPPPISQSSSSRSLGGTERHHSSSTRNNSPFTSSNSSVTRGYSRSESRSPERRGTSYAEKQMISGLEGELGNISQQLALSNQEKTGLKTKVRQLESEVNRLLGYENDNNRLRNEVRDLEDELQSAKDSFGKEVDDLQRDLEHFEDVRRSEERLKRELDDLANDPRPRMLEDKVNDLTLELRERDSKYDRDVLNLKLALENAERDADASKAISNKFQDQVQRIELEMKRVKYEKESDDEIIHKLREKASHVETLERQIDNMDRDRREQEDRIRRLSQELQHFEDDNSILREETAQIARLQGELHNLNNYIKDLEEQLHKSEDKFANLSDTLHAKERIDKEVEKSQIEEKSQLKKEVFELKSDLERAQKKVTDLTKDNVELEKKLQRNEINLKQVRQERDEIQRRELSISLEVNKLQRSIDDKISGYRTKLVEEQAVSKTQAARCKDLEEQIKQLRDNINDNNSSSNETMREMFNLQRAIKDHEATIDSLNKEREDQERRLKEAKTSIGCLEQDVSDKQQQIDIISQRVDSEKYGLTALQQEHDKEISQLQKKISDLSEELENLRVQKSATEQRDILSRSEVQKIEATVADLRRGMQQLESERNVATLKYKDLEQEKWKLEDAHKQLESKLNDIMSNEGRGKNQGRRNSGSNAYNFVGHEIEFLNDERGGQSRSEMKTGVTLDSEIEKLKKENLMLRALLEDDDKSEGSLEDLEERLFALEETKDAEIAILVGERSDLLTEISELRDRIQMLEGEIKRMKEEQMVRQNHIDKLRQKRDRKKLSIEARLKAYETSSCAGSVVTMQKIRAQMENNDTMSTVSAMTSISNGPPSEKQDSARGLEGMFPSSVSITGLSISEKSVFSERGRHSFPSKSKGKDPHTHDVNNFPSTIAEERDEFWNSRK